MFSTRLACEHGDVKIGWDDPNDAEIRTIIAKKLTEGYHFFRESPVDPDQHIRIRRIGDVGRHIIIPDEDLHELFTRGKIGIIVEEVYDTREMAGPERLRSVDEVAQANTVAHRGHRGG